MTRGAAFLADGEGGDDDVGDAAIVFQRAWMADERDRLALDLADASKRIAAEDALIRRLGDVTLIAVGEQPILGAVARSRRRREYEAARLRSKRRGFAVPFDQHVRPMTCGVSAMPQAAITRPSARARVCQRQNHKPPSTMRTSARPESAAGWRPRPATTPPIRPSRP